MASATNSATIASAAAARRRRVNTARYDATPLPEPSPTVSIIVPAKDEARTIANVLDRLADLPFATEVIVVDDGSDDDTAQIVQAHGGARLLRHERNQGKGAAVRTGIAASTGDFLVIQDADLEYDPSDLPKLLEPLFKGVADVVFGTRLRGGEPSARTCSGTTWAIASCRC